MYIYDISRLRVN